MSNKLKRMLLARHCEHSVGFEQYIIIAYLVTAQVARMLQLLSRSTLGSSVHPLHPEWKTVSDN